MHGIWRYSLGLRSLRRWPQALLCGPVGAVALCIANEIGISKHTSSGVGKDFPGPVGAVAPDIANENGIFKHSLVSMEVVITFIVGNGQILLALSCCKNGALPAGNQILRIGGIRHGCLNPGGRREKMTM